MKIHNRGRGIHDREVPGVERLQAELPDSWRAYTNLELAIPGGGREIDLVMVVEDRILAVDLKDWKGRIESGDGGWKHNGRQVGDTSPVAKILNNARELHIKLSRFVQADAQRRRRPKVMSPRVQGFVVLTACQDRSGIAPTEVDAVFTIDAFIKILRSVKSRIEAIGGVAPDFHNGELLTGDWSTLLGQFFNVKTGAFRPSSRQYGSYRASTDSHCFRHATGIFTEFDVEDPVAKATGLLRRWDFTKAETRFQTEDGRREIAGRERVVLAWLNDRNAACETAFLQPRVEDAEMGVEYWEVFDRRRKLQRLSDFGLSAHGQGNAAQQIELLRQMLAQASLMHELQTAHLDIGAHSIWLEPPSTVRFSHLMAASLPEVQTLAERRYQFLSSAILPETALKLVTTPPRKDVFLLGCAAHHLLFSRSPSCLAAGEPPDWNPAVDTENKYVFLHDWFKQALAWDPKERFENATAMLAALNATSTAVRSPQSVLAGLDSFREIKSQRQLLKEYPETCDLGDDQRVAMWRSENNGEPVVVKLWKREGWGDQAREAPRILAFLEAAREMILEPVPGFVRLTRALWLGDAIALVHQYEDGPTLEAALSSDVWLALAVRRDFSLALINVVTAAHERNVGHGDIKPENIIVRYDAGTPRPVLLDVLDFSPEGDGERKSPAYCPASGGKFERDRFATTVVIERVMSASALSDRDKAQISEAVSRVRTGPPENGSLLPLKEVLDELARPAPLIGRTVTIAIPQAEPGSLLPDEGTIAFRRSPDGSTLFVRGVAEQLVFQVSRDRILRNARRGGIEQKRIFQHFEIAIPLTLQIQSGAFEELSELEYLLQEPELAPLFQAPPKEGSAAESAAAAAIEENAPEDDEAEDDLADELEGETLTKTQVDVPFLWQRLMTVESDLKIEGVALGDSSYRRGISRHVIPFQMEQGLLEFDRDDSVLVSRVDSSGRSVRLGYLDVHACKGDFLQIDASRFWRNTDTIAKDGQRLQFTSHYEQTSRSRRREALDRVLARSSRIPDLVDFFDTRASRSPHAILHEVDEDGIAATYRMNPIQSKAFASLVKIRPLGLLQGPPGTGKTRFIGALVHYALVKGLARNVLVASQSHEAVNGAAEALLRLFRHDESPSILRVGHEGDVSEILLPYHVARVETLLKDRFRSQYRERLATIGQMLRLPTDVLAKLVHVEAVIAPLVDKILQLPPEDSRLSALYETLRNVSSGLLVSGPFDGKVDDHYTTLLSSEIATEHGISNLAAVERFSEAAQLGRDFMNSTSSRRRNFESFLAGTRQVVVGTCVGLGRASLGLTSTPFDLVIVDEAARCTAGELLVPLQAGRWAVLVGDHRQLEPQHRKEIVDLVAKTARVSRAELVKSDFERVFEGPYGAKAGSTLTEQYRMLPPIGTVVSDAFYPKGLTHGRPEPLIPAEVLPPSLTAPLTWVFTDRFGLSAYQRQVEGRRGALQNPMEAELIVELLRDWDQHDPFKKWLESKTAADDRVIGIICAYRAQADLLRIKLRGAFVSDSMRSAIKIDTVDSYQGKENLIVILSLVRNNVDGPAELDRPTIAPGFMSRPNRINVAVSRAMDRLVLVGASDGWRQDSPLGRVVAAFARQEQLGLARSVDGLAFLEQLEAERTPKKHKGAKSAQDNSGDTGSTP